MTKTEKLLLVNVNDASRQADELQALLAAVMDHAYRSKRKKPACLDLLITTDPEMAKMNRRHLGRDNATDVLAFEDGEEEDGRIRLGDVAISADTAGRVAEERGVAFELELVFYALHGLFHLLGMRDDDDGDRAAMLRAQAKAMRDFGLDFDETALT